MLKLQSLRRVMLITGSIAGWAGSACALDYATFERDGERFTVSGEAIVRAQDGGLMIEAADGVMWTIPAEELVEHRQDDKPLVRMPDEEVGERLQKTLPEGFQVYTTQHYLICHNTSLAYARWCGSLYERLYKAFINYWQRRGFELNEPEYRMVAVVFADARSFQAFAQQEVGPGASSLVGYYSLETNRVTMFDVTGIQGLRQAGDRRGSTDAIQRMLSRPGAAWTVATIVHEATHQLAFNTGLQRRFADIPLWLSEGIAVYFETPDLSRRKGWRAIGEVNPVRLTRFREFARRRGTGSLESLLANDARFRDAELSKDAYAEAWALVYFLIRQYPAEFDAYLARMAAKPPQVWDDESTRLAEFAAAFGTDLRSLDAEMVRYVLAR